MQTGFVCCSTLLNRNCVITVLIMRAKRPILLARYSSSPYPSNSSRSVVRTHGHSAPIWGWWWANIDEGWLTMTKGWCSNWFNIYIVYVWKHCRTDVKQKALCAQPQSPVVNAVVIPQSIRIFECRVIHILDENTRWHANVVIYL